MIDMIGNIVSSSIARDKNPRDLVFTKLDLSPVFLRSPIRELPLFPPISRRESSAAQGTQDKTDLEGITWRKHKGCRCKQSKCLKLYCECFASGVFCSDCDCTGCHNNFEHSDVREAAMVNVLDRNPKAFNVKNSSNQINKQYEAAPDTELGLLSRGCKCKRTKCLKKYCECFQANVMCSEKCKCIHCKNVSEGFQPSGFDWGLNNRKLFDSPEKNVLLSDESNTIVWENNNNVNALGLIAHNTDYFGFNDNVNAGCINAPGFLVHSSPQVYRRRRHRELAEWSSFTAPLSWEPDNSILDAQGSPMSISPKLPYRKKKSRLGYTTTLLPDLGDICSLLLAASESAIANAEEQNRIYIKPNDKEDNTCIESRNVEEEIPSCGRLIELIDAQYNAEEDSQCKTKISDNVTDIYMEQERAVLETFSDCLHKFMEVHKR